MCCPLSKNSSPVLLYLVNASGLSSPQEAFPDLPILPSKSQLANAAYVGEQSFLTSEGNTAFLSTLHLQDVCPEELL